VRKIRSIMTGGKMQLIVWRHAEAEDEAATDMLRNLTAKGQREAAKMAAWLNAQIGVDWDRWEVIASPANRAQQTAAALERPFKTLASIAPDAPASAVLAAAGWPSAPKHVIIVGHQPTLGMVAAWLMNGGAGYVSVKKGAMWWFEVRQRDGQPQTVLKAMVTPDTVSFAKTSR
jgi:phosphohistidine phosphatase